MFFKREDKIVLGKYEESMEYHFDEFDRIILHVSMLNMLQHLENEKDVKNYN